MPIELWHIPLLVMAVVVGVKYATGAVPKLRRISVDTRKRLRTVALGAVCVVLLLIFIRSVTPVLNAVAAAASLLMEGAALRLTYLVYQDQKATPGPRAGTAVEPAPGDTERPD